MKDKSTKSLRSAWHVASKEYESKVRDKDPFSTARKKDLAKTMNKSFRELNKRGTSQRPKKTELQAPKSKNQIRVEAVQAVRKSKKSEILGEGVDAVVRDYGDKVVKSPSISMQESRYKREGKEQFKKRTKIQKNLENLGSSTQYVETSRAPYMVQEKLSPLFEDNARSGLSSKIHLDELRSKVEDKGYVPEDLSPKNSGFDKKGKLKALDVGEFEHKSLPELPDEYIDDISISKKNAGKFIRKLPMIGSLMGLAMSDDVSAAIDPTGSTSMDYNRAIEDPSSPEYAERISLIESLKVKKKDK